VNIYSLNECIIYNEYINNFYNSQSEYVSTLIQNISEFITIF